MFRQALVLPIAFSGSCILGVVGAGGVCGGLDCVCGGVAGVTGHVGGSGGLASGTGGSSGRTFIRVAGGGVGGDSGGSRHTHPYLATRPCSRCLDGYPRSVVIRVLLLEVREHVLGAVGGPERQ